MLYYNARLFNYNSTMGTLPCIIPKAAYKRQIKLQI
jgi:hypothetical protein